MVTRFSMCGSSAVCGVRNPTRATARTRAVARSFKSRAAFSNRWPALTRFRASISPSSAALGLRPVI